MKKADITWKNAIATSKKYDEVYFSIHGGLEETNHVFLKGNNLPNAWREKELFTIGEAGFGTGLNFLATWDLYEKSEEKPKDLYFISVEKEPLGLEDLKKAHLFYPTLSRLACKLQEKYPPLSEGLHFLDFGSVKLMLCFGDIKEVFKNLTCKVNAWFLDGFSPSKNPDMWDLQTLRLIKNLSLENATLSTYSVAGILRKNLTTLGFEWVKKEGFGKKKNMLFASLKENSLHVNKPWFCLPNPTKEKKAIILGAGIAGSSIAYLLGKRGWEVDVLEKGEKPAYGGSGNHCGVVAPLITKPDIDLGKFYERAFLQSLAWYNKLVDDEGGFFGVKHYAYDKTYQKRWDIWNEKQNELFTCKEDEIGKYFDILNAGFVQPYKICQKLINSSSNIRFHGLNEVSSFTCKEGIYHVLSKNGKLYKAPVLIIALGIDSESFFPNNSFLLQKIRGQVTFLPKAIDTKQPLCANGYVCPYIEGKQIIGATYIKDDNCLHVREDDNIQNLLHVKEFLTCKEDFNPKKLDGRVSFRSSSNDRFPIIGAICDEEFYKKEYKALPWKKHKPNLFENASYLKNLYISTAHGSRGLTSAILGANIITSMCEGLPIPLEENLLHALHPARFTIRRLQRQEVW